MQVAALARRGADRLQLVTVHWFYLYVVWFTPLVLAALFAAQRDRERVPRDLDPRGAVVLLAATFCLTFLVDPWQHELVSDVPLYRAYADVFLDGVVPYRDIGFEYPPLAAPLIALPGPGLARSRDLPATRSRCWRSCSPWASCSATGRLAALGGGDASGRRSWSSRWHRSRPAR